MYICVNYSDEIEHGDEEEVDVDVDEDKVQIHAEAQSDDVFLHSDVTHMLGCPGKAT